MKKHDDSRSYAECSRDEGFILTTGQVGAHAENERSSSSVVQSNRSDESDDLEAEKAENHSRSMQSRSLATAYLMSPQSSKKFMAGDRDGIRKESPVHNSVQGQEKLKAKESNTSQQPALVQRTPMGQTAEENHNGRQEPDADGSTSLADSEETTEAIRRSPRAESRRGRTAVGKSGQGAMKDRKDPSPKKHDSYADISPGKNKDTE